jgi:hypothetical protein
MGKVTDGMQPTDVPNPVALAILWDGYYSPTYLGSVNGQASEFAEDPAEIKREVVEATGWLLDRGLVSLYSVDNTRSPEDVRIRWVGNTAEQRARLERVYTPDAPDWRDWWYECWFQNTEAGDALAAANPPEPWSDDD